MTKKINLNKGFTLIEALVSIAILVTAVTGAFAAAQSGISSSIFSKNQIIAFYLAGEGVEQIRNKRDENGLTTTNNWLAGIAENSSDPCYSDGVTNNVCMVDAVASTITTCPSGVCPNLRLDPVNGFYGYNPGYASTTIFNRQIRMRKVNNNPDEWSISVIVDWSKGTVQRTFEVRENIMNWQ